MIKDSQVSRLNKKLGTPEKVQSFIDDFRMHEPVLYSMMRNHAKCVIDNIVVGGHELSPSEITRLHDHICMPYVFMWVLYKENRDLLVEKIVSNDQFKQFIEGKSPDKFYKYSLKDIDPESTLYKAKIAKKTNDLQRLRKLLLPILAEDVGMGSADDDILKKVDKLNERPKPKQSKRRKSSNS